MRKWTWLRRAALWPVALLALPLAGCGGDAPSSSTASPMLLAQSGTAVAVTPQAYRVTILSDNGHVLPLGVNAQGQITGGLARAPSTNWHAFLYAGGRSRDLGTLPGGDFSVGKAINASGRIAGDANVATGGGMHAFYYNGIALKDLGTFGGAYSYSVAINDNNQVTGYANLPGDQDYHAFLYEGATIRDIGTLGGTSSNPFALNRAGYVVGTSDITGNAGRHGFVYDGHMMRDLGTLGGHGSDAYDINNAGQIIGVAQLAPDDTQHGFLYQGGTMRDLGTLGGSQSFASDINDAGQIAGAAQLADGSWRPVLFSGSSKRNLGSLGGDAYAFTINAKGQVIGYAYTAGNARLHGFVWSPGDATLVDLNTRLLDAPAGIEIVEPWAIGDDGSIVADTNLGLALLTPTTCPPASAPVIGALVTNGERIAIGHELQVRARFTDADRSDSHTASWSWGPHDSESAQVSEANGVGTVSGHKIFKKAGVYRVTLTVSDSGGKSSQASRTITVFDPACRPRWRGDCI